MIFIETKLQNYELKYDFNSVCALESVAGKDIGSIFADKHIINSLTFYRTLIWAGLIHKNRAITQDMVGDIIQLIFDEGKNIEYLEEIIEKSFFESEFLKKLLLTKKQKQET